MPLGKAIKVTGTTNRKVGTPIIVTVEGLEKTTPKLKPKIATVEADEGEFYNKFSVSFDTTTANIGKYEVTADNNADNNSSADTENTKTEKELGFEAIFTVAGLLVVVVMWLLRRRKKR